MIIWHAIVLGLLQGLTEFFPVSSSGHLVIVPWMAGWDDFAGSDSIDAASIDAASLKTGFDVALHLGTLVGALAYFRKDVKLYAVAGLRMLKQRTTGEESSQGSEAVQPDSSANTDGKTAWLIVASAVPISIVGAAFSSVRDSWNDEIWLAATMLLVFGALLWLADVKAAAAGNFSAGNSFGTNSAIAMGLAQTLALVPGVSRSGITISAGRLSGLGRTEAAHFAFLMGLPVILGAGIYQFYDIGGWPGIPVDYRAGFVWGAITAAASSWLAIWGLMRLVRRWTFAPYAVERALLAIAAFILLAASVR